MTNLSTKKATGESDGFEQRAKQRDEVSSGIKEILTEFIPIVHLLGSRCGRVKRKYAVMSKHIYFVPLLLRSEQLGLVTIQA